MKTLITTLAFSFISLLSIAQDCSATIDTQCPPLKISFTPSGLKDHADVDLSLLEINQLKARKFLFNLNNSKEHFSFMKKSMNRKMMYNDQCENFRQVKNIGGYTILGGGIITTIGVVMVLKDGDWLIGEGNQQFNTGVTLWVAGDIIQAVGIILNITGKIGYRHCNKSALHLKSDGNNIGLAYNF